MKRVVVLGATGTMGRRWVALARRALPELELVAVSRRGGAVEGARAVALNLGDATGLGRLLAGGDGLLVNAVGPFDYAPGLVVEACIDAGFHYTDLAETPAFVAAVDAAGDRAAAAGLTLVSGASTTPGLVELLARHWATEPAVTGIEAWLSLGSKNPLGAGMLEGLLRPLGRTGPDGTRTFAQTVAREGRRYGRYPSGFDGDRLRLGEREVPVRFYVGFDRALLVCGLSLAAPGLARVSDRALRTFARSVLPVARAASRVGTPRGQLCVVPVGAPGRIEVHAERNGLDIPAAPALWVAQRLAAGAGAPRGSVRLADVVPLGHAVAWLRDAGYEVRGLP